MPTLGLLLNETNARRQRTPLPEVRLLLVERTLFDPPRAGAARRWLASIRRTFPGAEVVPYVWHLVSHGPEDGLREGSTRKLEGSAHAFGHLQGTTEVAQAWTSARECYRALESRRVVLRTPAGVSPGPVGRDRIREFVAQRQAEGFAVVWEPEGLWEPALACQFGRELGIEVLVRGFHAGRPIRDPEQEGGLVAKGAWIRVDGVGRRPRMSGDQLDALLEHASVEPEAVIVFAGPRAITNLEAFREALPIDE